MRTKIAAVAVAAWLLGIGTGLLWLAATGGWYDYYITGPSDNLVRMVNVEHWQPIQISDRIFLKRPRFHLP